MAPNLLIAAVDLPEYVNFLLFSSFGNSNQTLDASTAWLKLGIRRGKKKLMTELFPSCCPSIAIDKQLSL